MADLATPTTPPAQLSAAHVTPSRASGTSVRTWTPDAIRGRFPDPRDGEPVRKPLVYLDSAATSQKPLAVIEA